VGVTVASADDAAPNWQGFYVGIHGGGGWGTTAIDDPYNGDIYGGDVTSMMFFGGLQGGYNWQGFPNKRFVVGIEGDFDFADADGTNTCNAVFTDAISANCHTSPNFFASLAARLGYTWGPEGRTLTYVKGGAALIKNDIVVQNNESSPFLFPSTRLDDTKIGWTAGFGVEQQITPAWSLKAEYDYYGFGNDSMQMPETVAPACCFLPGLVTDVHQRYGLVKLGLNYRIGEDPWGNWGGSLLGVDGMHGIPAGWSFDTGIRYWRSSGKFQWDVGLLPPSDPIDTLISRLTYRSLDGNTAELFETVNTPWNVFVKANVGVGNITDGDDKR